MPVKSIVLGDDETIVQFTVNGVTFECFPLDDVTAINDIAAPEGREPLKGNAFCKVCQEQLATHGVKASLDMSFKWYDALCKELGEQEGFFVESPASSGPTDSLPLAGAPAQGADANSATTNSGSLNSRKTRSRPKNSRKPS